jgi:tetratricopeptide (TPR) repeat protein
MDEQDQKLDSFLSTVRAKQKRVATSIIVASAVLLIVGVLFLSYSTKEVKEKIDQVNTLEDERKQLENDIEEKRKKSEELTQKLEEQSEQLEKSQKIVQAVKAPPPKDSQPVDDDPLKTGIRAYHKGKYDDAIQKYDKALSQDPNNAYIWNLKGYALFKARRYNESLGALRKAVDMDPGYAWGYFDIARVNCAISNFDEASNAIQKALQLRPSLKDTMKRDNEFTRLCRSIFK